MNDTEGRRSEVHLVRGEEPFILVAMVSLLVGAIWLFLERELMLGHFYRPELLSVTHTLTLGWISMIMMGVLVRMSKRALHVTIESVRLLRVQFLLMLVGYTGMVFHFWVSGFWAMGLAAILILLAAALQIINLKDCFSRLRNHGWLPRYVAAALVHFFLAALLGVLLGFDKVFDFLGGQFFSNIYAHIHLAAVGWVSMMIVGFEGRLLPLSRPTGRWGEAGIRFWLLEIGILGLASSLLLASTWTPVFAACIAISFFLHVRRPVWHILRGKIKDRASFWAGVALVFLLVESVIGLLLSLGIPDSGGFLRIHLQFAYGYMGLLGWITLTISAQVYKLFPMFVWEERFLGEFGKKPVPAMKELYSKKLQTVSNGFISLGVVGTVAGIVSRTLPLITFFHGMVIIGITTFILNFILMARWALLGKTYRPTAVDWERFHRAFPKAGHDRP